MARDHKSLAIYERNSILMGPLRILSLVKISSAFPVFCICIFIIKACFLFLIPAGLLNENMWRHRLLYSYFKRSCFGNMILNVLAESAIFSPYKSRQPNPA